MLDVVKGSLILLQIKFVNIKCNKILNPLTVLWCFGEDSSVLP